MACTVTNFRGGVPRYVKSETIQKDLTTTAEDVFTADSPCWIRLRARPRSNKDVYIGFNGGVEFARSSSNDYSLYDIGFSSTKQVLTTGIRAGSTTCGMDFLILLLDAGDTLTARGYGGATQCEFNIDFYE